MNTLTPISSPHRIEVPFIKASFGGVDFGLTDRYNGVTGVRQADFITRLNVKKYGSGAVNQYTLTMVYLIDENSDPNYVDMVLSKATNREIYFTYGDMSQPEYSYKNEKGIITNVVPNVDYKNNKITYTITATSSTTLSYAVKKKTFPAKTAQPSQEIIRIVKDSSYGIKQLLPGMADITEVLKNGWIPQDDMPIQIAEKKDISPMDYILYLVSLMRGRSGNFYFLKIFDSIDGSSPHFEIVSTTRKGKEQMLTITVGYPGSIPVHNLTITQDSSTALLVEYRDSLEQPVYQDYSFRGDLVKKDFYSVQTNKGTPSANAKNWWDKMISFPISATLVTEGLYVPAEIVQSIYLDIFFFGKRYNHSGEYLIMEQEDDISASGFRTTLQLLRVGDYGV